MLRKMMLASVVTMMLFVGQSMAATVNGTVSARLWGAADPEADFTDALALGKTLGLGDYAPTWEVKPGESATFGLYVNLGSSFPGWMSYNTGNVVGFEFTSSNKNTTEGLGWSVAWDETCTITPTNASSIWQNNDFLFKGAILNSDPDVDFFTKDGTTLEIGAKDSGETPFFGSTPAKAASAAGSKGYLLGVFKIEVSSDSPGLNSALISFGVAGDTLDGIGFDGLSQQNIVIGIANADGLVTVVTPEPATYAMLCGLGLVGAAWYRRNRRKA